MTFEILVKKAFNRIGLDLRRLKNLPSATFLGLSERPIDTILDVGANNGGFAKWITTFMPRAKLHCFEPLAAPCVELLAWGKGRSEGSIAVHQFAVGDREGTASFLEHLDHTASSSMLPVTSIAQQLFPETCRTVARDVEVVTLDGWMKSQPPDSLGRMLLKLDVQGMEDRVLKGATITLKSVDICITEVSVASLYEGQADFSELVRILSASGLHYIGNLEQIHDECGVPLYLDCVFVRRNSVPPSQ